MKTEGATYEQATELESQIDDSNRSIHDQCLTILTLQSPVAGDARLVTGILECIVDLEQIADYAYEVSELAVRTGRRPISQLFTQVVTVGEKVCEMLTIALDSWRHLDRLKQPTLLRKRHVRR
jgi:phosphate transport system protein